MSAIISRISQSSTRLGLIVGLTGLAVQPAMGFLPSWSDLFTSLQPFREPEVEDLDLLEDGEGRLGFVQLNSGTNSFNATINLTGHILLGLGIASALLARLFLEALRGKGSSDSGGYSSDSGYGRRRKRSLSSNETLDEMTDLIPPLLEKLEQRFRKSGLDEVDCWTRIVCEANRPQLEFKFNTLGNAIRDIYEIIEENLKDGGTIGEEDDIVIRHFNALNLGSQGKDCKSLYPKCSKAFPELLRILHS